MADRSGATGVGGAGDDGGGPDDLLTGGPEGDGEAAAVRIGVRLQFSAASTITVRRAW
ncbi:hypothetical protein [Streptomyces sp. DT171]|uniref:hypothetical protein n=1 Tax=Streptomyces sp. DT171 TaxID=3416524 RepID=UPI003CF7F76A